MKARFLVLAIVLLCVLVAPASALAADIGKIDPRVTTVLAATGGDEAVPVLVYTEPDATAIVADSLPDAVDTTELPVVDAVAAYLTPEEILALTDDDQVDLIAADNPVFGFDYQSSLDITNLTIGLGDVASPQDGGPTGQGVTVAVLDSGVSTTTPDLEGSRIVGWKDIVNGKSQP